MKNAILELTKILQQVALVESPSLQVQYIVDAISQTMAIDVCSLYRCNAQKEMQLLASHGLVTKRHIRIPAGKGLVGLVAKNRRSINLSNAALHPDYYYVAKSREEQFHSFCGVPMVSSGKVVGVLVVQSKKEEAISDEYEAFLLTLASQLALIIVQLPLVGESINSSNIRITGNKGSAGIGIGKVLVCDNSNLLNVVDEYSEDPKLELENWAALLEKVKDNIHTEQASLSLSVSAAVNGIFDVYSMLLRDQTLVDYVSGKITFGFNLPSALKHGIQHFADIFRQMQDPYLQARGEDILHLGNKLYIAWQKGSLQEQSLAIPDGPIILVGKIVSVSDIAHIPLNQLMGIVCFLGSSLSHTAVLANAIGVPAVMGVGKIKDLKPQELLIVDGNEGQIIRQASDAIINEFTQLINKEQALSEKLLHLRDLDAVTTDNKRIHLFTNTGLLADISPGLKSGAEGVGLYRTEIPFIIRDSFPTEDEQIDVYRKVLEAYHDKPVYMRTLDIGGDKQLPYFPINNEDNPALGWRGIRFSLDNIQLLMTQVRAMIKASNGADNLHILLPMVSSSYEIDTFIQLLDDACEQLANEGVHFLRPKVGVMIEVPAAISQIHFWRKKIDFISIGTNDLSQYVLAMDRTNPRVSAHYDHVHPAVLHEIKRIVDIAQSLQLPLSLCGEMAADPVAVVLLLGMGIERLSMSATKLPRIKWLIRTISQQQAQSLLAQALQLDKVEAIRTMVSTALSELGLNELRH